MIITREFFGLMYPHFVRHVKAGMAHRDILRRVNRYGRLFITSTSVRHSKKYYLKWVYWIGVVVISQRFMDHDYHGAQGEQGFRDGQGAGLPGPGYQRARG